MHVRSGLNDPNRDPTVLFSTLSPHFGEESHGQAGGVPGYLTEQDTVCNVSCPQSIRGLAGILQRVVRFSCCSLARWPLTFFWWKFDVPRSILVWLIEGLFYIAIDQLFFIRNSSSRWQMKGIAIYFYFWEKKTDGRQGKLGGPFYLHFGIYENFMPIFGFLKTKSMGQCDILYELIHIFIKKNL